MFKKKKTTIPSNEYTDNNGKKWIQTSAEDLFSNEEITNLVKRIEKETEPDEIVLAQFDFKTVNKEYYETLTQLQKEVKRKDQVLKKLALESKEIVERKNKKLIELINYIKKLHMVIALKKLDKESIDKINISPEMILNSNSSYTGNEENTKKTVQNVDAIEIDLDDNGEEIK